ncbi:putative pre-mRNA branch site protein p14 [Toxoplasma gondii TgCatPRC2]|uniref:Pre-mRNA branch site protein p14, putative n=15 Tax=Toxoplasma gondii TaxID=5811 RepID=A0A125YY00_TOXGM|nr:pre-mRNA branch site protein p14, putative [Toxoplasma gondii ME49]EPR57458.1 putative pre-mRNA branch site protein p14 [Toxoplasma gondii GT1]ESS29024.1 putative pre-mRNA branch site protein p14 [Toxoplasma gondii VEG]KAF4644684.1 putative pre-mRNA branch site protein p14 [Toxoplasma gondii]KFG28424.1 putative pre-mRNA branch site protein p14 [Toxoplasma gondii p89]KFG33217.1 putative pre-mRNA branch site protein p14 [Toxoplasma gondii GAB2-2007-GAL-DOM2]KFG45544.1 putative pre-mRNA branc|eukprot:XP_002370295.1 pre-mRNA branch site protein p14, putative [Toxoplasma gondii ME49]
MQTPMMTPQTTLSSGMGGIGSGQTPGTPGTRLSSSGVSTRGRPTKIAPDMSRIIYVRNLPFKITDDELYDIFGKYGAVRQIRKGNTDKTRGSAFVVYEDVLDARAAVDQLSGFNVAGRYLIVLYYNPQKAAQRQQMLAQKEELERIRQSYQKKSGA